MALVANIALTFFFCFVSNAMSADVCFPVLGARACSKVEKIYRLPNGECNNLLAGRSHYGAMNTVQLRFARNNLPANTKLPSPRHASAVVLIGKNTPSPDVTDMLKTFGQFLDHDATLTPHGSFSECESCQNTKTCFPIPVADDDNRISDVKCLPFARSSVACQTTQPEQVNVVTAFIDGSNIYGSSDDLLKTLKDPKRKGYLATNGRNLPFLDASKSKNFVAGDTRVNENLQLIAMHNLWVLFHNYVADKLTALPAYSGLSEEILFQEVRKLTASIYQKIVFQDYLESVLGRHFEGQPIRPYQGYNHNAKPFIFNSFSTAAFRFGHTQIQNTVRRFEDKCKPSKVGDIPLRRAFNNPDEYLNGGGMEPLLQGLFCTKGRKQDPGTCKPLSFVTRENLFQAQHIVAEDLPALNMQRGRDHQIPTFKQMKEIAQQMTNKIIPQLDSNLLDLLKKYYDNLDHVDLWLGGVLENSVKGAQVGPTFHFLLSEQFRLVRDGDRFYYRRCVQWNNAQIEEIDKWTLAKVICASSKIENVPENVFRVTKPEDFKRCADLLKPNFSLFKPMKYGEACSKAELEKLKTSNESKDEISEFNEETVEDDLFDPIDELERNQ